MQPLLEGEIPYYDWICLHLLSRKQILKNYKVLWPWHKADIKFWLNLLINCDICLVIEKGTLLDFWHGYSAHVPIKVASQFERVTTILLDSVFTIYNLHKNNIIPVIKLIQIIMWRKIDSVILTKLISKLATVYVWASFSGEFNTTAKLTNERILKRIVAKLLCCC